MRLRIDYDRMNIYAVVRFHKYLRGLVRDLGWRVWIVNVWTSHSRKGKHVEIELTFSDYASRRLTSDESIIALEQIFRSDPRRGLHEISRILSPLPEWKDQDNWDLFWENHYEDPKGKERLRKVWK